jgi:ubiquinone/menaquinone biosynthesis C-methylase UbiE
VAFYNLIAPGYDLFLKRLYRPFREQAFTHFPEQAGATVLDVACGTGQNFPYIAKRVGLHGTIVGVDNSWMMLRGARRSLARCNNIAGHMLRYDARQLSPQILRQETRLLGVDVVVCTFGFSAMRDWKIPFHRSYDLLKPGGRYLILDVHAEKKTPHVRAVEIFTRSRFTRESWQYLDQLCPDFHMEYIDPSSHLFGGRVFVAYGTKPFPER